MSSKSKKKVKKLALILITSTWVTATRKKVDKTANITKDDGKKGEGGEYPESHAQVLYIRYSIIFWKKLVPISALFD